MADQKLSQLTAREATSGDPFNDLLYYYVAAGATDADKQRKTTPADILTGTSRRRMAWIFDDLIGVSHFNMFGNVDSSNQNDQEHQGCYKLSTKNDPAGAGFMTSNYNTLQLGGGAMRLIFWFKAGSLSTSGDRYLLWFGMGADWNTVENQSGFYIKYRDNLNGGKWQFVCRNGGAETALDTGITVAANTWYRVQFDVNADFSSVAVDINGTSAGPITTNIPTNASMAIEAFIVKMTGTSDMELHVDAVSYMKHLSSGR